MPNKLTQNEAVPHDIAGQDNLQLLDNNLPDLIDASLASDHVFCEDSGLFANSHLWDVQLSIANSAEAFPQSIPSFLVNSEYALIEYYFKEVAVIYSCYDGEMNPFRSNIAKLWTSSAEISKTLQSMAAACLAPSYPHLYREGFKLRHEVLASINNKTSECGVRLLVTIMLGQTTGWHNPRDLGLEYFQQSKAILHDIHSNTHICPLGKDVSFYENALGYWETLLAFVTPQKKLEPFTRLFINRTTELIEPHPWALTFPDLLSLVRQTGSLILCNRQTMKKNQFLQRSQLKLLEQIISNAFHIEEQLMYLDSPDNIIDPMDITTPTWHLQTISQIYRFVALIMLYRIFPDILEHRMETDMLPYSPRSVFLNPAIEYDRNVWLRQFTLHTLNLLRTIPLESHTRCVQPFLLITLSCEIGSFGIDPFLDSERETEEARDFIRTRLEAFQYCLPPKPAEARVKLVLEIWRTIDATNSPKFWLDIVIEQEWQYLFG